MSKLLRAWDAATCLHPQLTQVSTLLAETTWTREDDGTYSPDEAITKVLHEETEWFVCDDCDERIDQLGLVGRP